MVILRRLALIALCAAASVGACAADASGRTWVPRVQCDQPARLRLQRFEDGSAKLWCGARLLMRVSVPW